MKSYILYTLIALAVQTITSSAQVVSEGSLNITNPQLFFHSQEQAEWCWAACNQMLLAAAGILETQTDQATKRTQLFGGSLLQGAGASFTQSGKCLNGTYTNTRGQTVKVQAWASYVTETNPLKDSTIIDTLRTGFPVVVATTQHGRVCVGVDYVTDANGVSRITTMKLLDPGFGLFPVPQTDIVTMAQLRNEGFMGYMKITVSYP